MTSLYQCQIPNLLGYPDSEANRPPESVGGEATDQGVGYPVVPHETEAGLKVSISGAPSLPYFIPTGVYPIFLSVGT